MLLCSCALLPGCVFLPPQTDYTRFTSEQLNDFGVVYEQAGNFREAERVYKKALAKDPANYIAASNLANIYCHNGKLDKAMRYYREALTVCPGYVPALNNLANVQIETRDYAGAEENLQKALSLAETREEKRAVYLSFASLNKSTGDEEESEKWTEKAEALKPSTVISDVPFFKQRQYDCGPAALACVYNFLGVKQDPEEISQRVYSRRQKGSLNLQLLIDAREQGLAATMYSGSFEHIKEAVDSEIPLILMLSENGELLHYVVVVGYEGGDLSSLVVHDGYEAFKKQSRPTLEQKWSATGYCTIEMREAR
ncbi:MAG: tetratricopeptide repeat protein [Planctomycetota bacterium]